MLAQRALFQLQNNLAISVRRPSRLADLVHVFADCGNELARLDGTAKPPEVHGILRVNDDAKPYA